MAYELKDMSGNLFVNTNKASEKHPSYKGSVKLLGKQYDLAVWVRRDRNNQAYWSFELNEPWRGGGQGQQGPQQNQRAPMPDNGDDIPF